MNCCGVLVPTQANPPTMKTNIRPATISPGMRNNCTMNRADGGLTGGNPCGMGPLLGGVTGDAMKRPRLKLAALKLLIESRCLFAQGLLIKGATMARRYVQQLTDGETVDEVYLVSEKQLRANRNGNLYLQIELRDRTGAISGRLWNAGEQVFRSFEEGDFLQVKGKVQLFQGALQIILNHLDRIDADKVELADFLPHTEQDVSKLLERLRSVLLKMSNPHLRALAECFLMDEEFVADFCSVPAGVRNHHAYLGGLLEHVVNCSTLPTGCCRFIRKSTATCC